MSSIEIQNYLTIGAIYFALFTWCKIEQWLKRNKEYSKYSK